MPSQKLDHPTTHQKHERPTIHRKHDRPTTYQKAQSSPQKRDRLKPFNVIELSTGQKVAKVDRKGFYK
ncbi:MAG: hypothetical protein ACOYMQ_09845, partial [Pseudanabaena sp.]